MSIDLLPGLTEIVRRINNSLTFNVVEVGALPLDGAPEPFHSLLDLFPGSTIHAFEVDHGLCEKLNLSARPGMVFHPVALGRTEEVRQFFLTEHPMCASLYRPNERLLERYNNLEAAMLRSVDSIMTTSLDHFAREHGIGPVDFIKIDVQGAELEIFQGGEETLKNVVVIVSEVEFIQFYQKQPLFGDVCAYLAEQQITFHKFLTLAGRTLRPTILSSNPNTASQHMWSDVMFLRDIMAVEVLDSDQLLKLAVLALIYYSADVSVVCLLEHDRRHGTSLCKEMSRLISILPHSQPLGPGSHVQKSRAVVANPKVGRNELCSCGSGKKYKHCHGVNARR